MAYDPKIIDAILQRASQVADPRARARYTRAALQTGIVESGLQNLDHGDADSEGWRQERRSLYPNPTNVTASVNRFFDEAAQLDRGQPSWQLAADVQRPAAQYRGRYKDVASQAAALLKGSGASAPAAPGTPPSAATGSSGSSQAAAPSSVLGDPGRAPDVTSLLSSLLSKPEQAPAQQAVAPPSFTARPAMPQGFQAPTPQPTAAAEQSGGVEDALSLLGSLGGTDPASGSPMPGEGQDAPQEPVVATVRKQRAAAKTATGVISPNARPGDPVVSRRQSVGGEHETMGLAGYPARDYFAPAGTHAVAPVNGTVVRLSGHDPANGPTNGPHGPLGYSVYIKGSDGRTYFLTHMGSRNVKPGQKVAQGQVIGTVADYDKYGTPSHIHMGVNG